MNKDTKDSAPNSSNQNEDNKQKKVSEVRVIPGTLRLAFKYSNDGSTANADPSTAGADNQNESESNKSEPSEPVDVPDSDRIKLLADVSVSVGRAEKWYENERNLAAETQLIQKYRQEMSKEEWEDIKAKCEANFTRNYTYKLWTEKEDAILVELFRKNKKKSDSEVKKSIMKDHGYERTSNSLYGRWKRLEQSKKQLVNQMLNRGKNWTEKYDKVLAYCVFKYPDAGVRAWSLMAASLRSFEFTATPAECKGRWFYLVNRHIENSK